MVSRPAATDLLVGAQRTRDSVPAIDATSEMGEYSALCSSIEEKSISGNAIANGANSAAPCASAQGNHLGISDKETATPINRARPDSLAYE
jgi:hypothetical protein